MKDGGADVPVLMVAGWGGSGPQHWQSLWERADPGMLRVRQRDWDAPDRAEWVAALDAAISAVARPPVLVAHSLGCIAVAHWAAAHNRPVAGALLVAPADVDRPETPPELRGFAPVPLDALPFSSIVVAGTTDPWASLPRAAWFARCWGSSLVNAGDAGHLNTDAGYGPWPAGERLLAQLRAGAEAT
ncbi:MAG: hypothetical protein JWM27_1724 [Gemmatimonadetes bacterium]|nr:hypothetical protein [Gemmatimonadota bacterium]